MKTITKVQFVALLDAAGITDEQKRAFHAAFEQQQPEAHESFLVYLGVAPPEIARIRAGSRHG